MMPEILLDTCATLWVAEGTSINRMAMDALREHEEAGAPVFVSPMTVWEISQLMADGRIACTRPADEWWETLLAREQISLGDLPTEVLIAATKSWTTVALAEVRRWGGGGGDGGECLLSL